MDESTQTLINNLHSDDKNVQNEAFYAVMEATEQPVDWAYDVWDTLLADLKHPDNHYRAIASQVLCNLAKSDPENRMLKDFDALFAVTRDERFVTARHCLQAVWKVGVVSQRHQQMVVDALENRFQECATEKNATLIRYDITQDLRNLYDATGDESIKEKALALIETETDAKYRKKYAGVWKAK